MIKGVNPFQNIAMTRQINAGGSSGGSKTASPLGLSGVGGANQSAAASGGSVPNIQGNLNTPAPSVMSGVGRRLAVSA